MKKAKRSDVARLSASLVAQTIVGLGRTRTFVEIGAALDEMGFERLTWKEIHGRFLSERKRVRKRRDVQPRQ